jgi:hypothetical protein
MNYSLPASLHQFIRRQLRYIVSKIKTRSLLFLFLFLFLQVQEQKRKAKGEGVKDA